MMQPIRLETMGRVDSGPDIGMFVEVRDDSEISGGFLILVYPNSDRSGEVFDSWVETIVDVELYFHEAGWEITWL